MVSGDNWLVHHGFMHMLNRDFAQGGQMSSAKILGGGMYIQCILQGGASQFSRGEGGKSIPRGPPGSPLSQYTLLNAHLVCLPPLSLMLLMKYLLQ